MTYDEKRNNETANKNLDHENADWTIMVYMAGDNNLSEDMAFSLREMDETSRRPSPLSIPDTDAVAPAKVNLLAFFDSNSHTVPTHYIDFSDNSTERHIVTPEDLFHYSKKNNGWKYRDPEASGTAYSILNFVRWCIATQKRTAKNYAIIFSGHSFGFYGTSFLGDQSSGNYMTLRLLRWVLEESVDLYFEKKIAIVGFDSCEMGMLEVGYELNTAAHTVIASEGNLPGSGWGYAPLLRGFFEDPQKVLSAESFEKYSRSVNLGFKTQDTRQEYKKLDPAGLRELIATGENVKICARWFVRAFIEQQSEYAIGGRSVDMAAWNLDVIKSVADNVGELGNSLLTGLAERKLTSNVGLNEHDSIVFNHVKSGILQSRVNCQTYMHEQAVDLKDFCQFLMAECFRSTAELDFLNRGRNKSEQVSTDGILAISTICKDIISGADKCVLAGGFVGDVYQFSNGLSLFFPWTAMTYDMTRTIYPRLRFVRGNNREKGVKHVPGPGRGWNDFLMFYLYNVTLRRSRLRPDDFEARLKKLENYEIDGLTCLNTRENLHLDETILGSMRAKNGGDETREDWQVKTREDWRVRTRENWLVGVREDWRVRTKEDWNVKTKEDWLLKTREDWRVKTKEDWRLKTKEDWNVKTREQLSDIAQAFDRIKNFQLNWQAVGYWDETCSLGLKSEFEFDEPDEAAE